MNITPDGFEVDTFNNIGAICSKYREFDCMIIDMPIGLPESGEDVRPDAYARKLLLHRSSCIFNTPCRQSVVAENYPEANEINRAHLGKGLSQQSFAISNKIREIDDFLKLTPDYAYKIMESHPEICFAMLNSSESLKPIEESKKTSEGKDKRISILQQHYDLTTDFIEHVRNNTELRKLEEDCIDALCLAVTGMLGIENGFNFIPETPSRDRRGLLMQMVYANKP